MSLIRGYMFIVENMKYLEPPQMPDAAVIYGYGFARAKTSINEAKGLKIDPNLNSYEEFQRLFPQLFIQLIESGDFGLIAGMKVVGLEISSYDDTGAKIIPVEAMKITAELERFRQYYGIETAPSLILYADSIR